MPILKKYGACDLTVEDARRIVCLLNGVWPTKDTTIDDLALELLSECEENPAHITLVLWDGNEAVAHATVFARDIRWDGGELRVMALDGLCVSKQHRGNGLGLRIAKEAFKLVDEGLYQVALFQTEIPEFYRRLGAVTINNEFWNSKAEDSDASPWRDPHVMTYPSFKTWPKGRIDLNGPGY